MYEFKDTAERIKITMKKLSSQDTSIEIIMRKLLWDKGYRYRKNYARLPGKPDIVLTKYKIAIFCDGEFFHGKDWEIRKPKLEQGNNGQYWVSKISRNKERDEIINNRLLYEGWTVIRFWGNDIKKKPEECVKVIEEVILDMKINDAYMEEFMYNE